MPPFSPLKPDKNETKQKTEIQMEISHSLSLTHTRTHTQKAGIFRIGNQLRS